MTIALLNDGTKNFAEKNDPRKHMLGSCNINYRNTQEPVFVKITYKENILSVSHLAFKYSSLAVTNILAGDDGPKKPWC